MDISKINLFSTILNLKDAQVRNDFANLKEWVDKRARHLYCLDGRFLIFDFLDAAHRSVKIKAGTFIDLPVTTGGVTTYRTLEVLADTSYDLSAMITSAAAAATDRAGEENGRVFHIYLIPNGAGGVGLTVSTRTDYPGDIDVLYTADNTRWIGCFSTLCVAVDAATTAVVPVAPGSLSVSDTYLVKPCYTGDDDFSGFYTRTVSAVTSGTYYDVATVDFPLAGFAAGDILPESVWCLGFVPAVHTANLNNVLGMVYDGDTDKAIDIYLQSGVGQDTATVYGATHTVSRPEWNHEDDMRQVGKMLLTDEEFSSAALGGNEKTNIVGSVDKTTVGGHSDTASRRMTSFIGCEEMTGYLWQWLREYSANGGSSWGNFDGQGNLGQVYGTTYALIAGGSWSNGSSCGSRCRNCDSARSVTLANVGGRGCSRIVKV